VRLRPLTGQAAGGYSRCTRAMRSPLPTIGLHRLAILAFLALGAGSLRARPPTSPIAWSVPSATVTVAAGGTIRVEVSANIDDGWPLHSLRQPSPPDPTRIAVPEGQPVVRGGKIEAPVPKSAFDRAQGADTEYYVELVTFSVPLSVARMTAPGKHAARIKTTRQACGGSIYLRPRTATLEVPLQVTTAK